MKAPFSATRRLELVYENGIRKILEANIPVKHPWQSFEEWIQQLFELSNRRMSGTGFLAERMVHWANIENAKSWREASARSQKSQKLYRLLQRELAGSIGMRYEAIIRQNAEMIQSIPRDIAQHLSGHLAKAQQMGMRADSIRKVMGVEFPKLAKWKVNLIARTEVAKASSALTQAKSEALGLPAYEWDTSEDQRVRKSHRNLQSVIVFWNDAPSPERLVGEKSTLGRYHAGNCPNCRCGASPILSLDDVRWPKRVYHGGRIQTMTLVKFRQLVQVPERIAA